MELAQQGAEVIVLPTSWNDGPGKLTQWQTLTLARALDATCYLAAAGAACPGDPRIAGSTRARPVSATSRLVALDGHTIVEAGFWPAVPCRRYQPGESGARTQEIPVFEIRRNAAG